MFTALIVAAVLQSHTVSPLIANGPRSNYRALLLIAPLDSEGPWSMNELRGGSLVDVGHLQRQRDGSYTVPVLFVRPRVIDQPEREVIIFHLATVRCGRDYDSGVPQYETVDGPVPLRADITWRPSLTNFELGLLRDIVCTPVKAGAELGPLSREEIVGMFDPDTAESIAARERSYRNAGARRPWE